MTTNLHSISLHEKAEIAFQKFFKGNQNFSNWICERLQEKYLDDMDPELKEKFILEESKRLKNDYEKSLNELREARNLKKIKINDERNQEELDDAVTKTEKQKQEDKIKSIKEAISSMLILPDSSNLNKLAKEMVERNLGISEFADLKNFEFQPIVEVREDQEKPITVQN